MLVGTWDSWNCGKPDELSTLTKNRNGAVVFLLPWPSSGKAPSTKRSGMLESDMKKMFSQHLVKTLSPFGVQTGKYGNIMFKYSNIALQWLNLISRGRNHRHSFSYFVLNYKKKKMPLPRIELTTFRVTARCSANELLWLMIIGSLL